MKNVSIAKEGKIVSFTLHVNGLSNGRSDNEVSVIGFLVLPLCSVLWVRNPKNII